MAETPDGSKTDSVHPPWWGDMVECIDQEVEARTIPLLARIAELERVSAESQSRYDSDRAVRLSMARLLLATDGPED